MGQMSSQIFLHKKYRKPRLASSVRCPDLFSCFFYPDYNLNSTISKTSLVSLISLLSHEYFSIGRCSIAFLFVRIHDDFHGTFEFWLHVYCANFLAALGYGFYLRLVKMYLSCSISIC